VRGYFVLGDWLYRACLREGLLLPTTWGQNNTADESRVRGGGLFGGAIRPGRECGQATSHSVFEVVSARPRPASARADAGCL